MIEIERFANQMKTAEHFLFLLVENFSQIAFACAVEPLRIANLMSGKSLYTWSYASANGQSAKCSNGSVTLVEHDFSHLPKSDHLFVLSGIHVQDAITPELISTLRKEKAHGRRIGAICSATYILAKIGFLDGLHAAIHWEFHDSFMEEFPEVNLSRSVFVADEKFITASGGTATADLMLHLIEKQHGPDLAIEVADQMLYNTVREASAEQRISLQSRHGIRNTHLTKAINLMAASVERPLSSADIAKEIGISTRQLERLFGRFLNCSPKKYFTDMRLQKARNLLLQTDKSVSEISAICGFGSSAHFSRAYRIHFGSTPVTQRSKIQ